MLIYLDFDGTVVEHDFPRMGRCNFGCFEVIKKLQDAGHEIVLNTYRTDIGRVELDAALKVVNEYNWRLLKDRSQGREFSLSPIKATEKKLYPAAFDIDEAKRLNVLYIDDMARNTPLKPACMTHGNMVDWDALDLIFEQFGLYTHS